jgi:hypothetical protein
MVGTKLVTFKVAAKLELMFKKPVSVCSVKAATDSYCKPDVHTSP